MSNLGSIKKVLSAMPSSYGAPDRQVSYWQKGCDDAKAGKHHSNPHQNPQTYTERMHNESYSNGYDFGKKSPNILAEFQKQAGEN